MEEHRERKRRLVVLTASPLHGHMSPLLQLATALHTKGFAIAIAHSQLHPPNPANHPPDFTFLPLSDNLSAVDDSGTFTNFINDLNNNCKASFKEHMTRLIKEGKHESIVVVYDNLMFFAGVVAVDLNLVQVVFRSCSAAYFPAFLARLQIRQEGRLLEEDFAMDEIVPNHDPIRYKDLPFPLAPLEDWRRLIKIFNLQKPPSAVIWNTIKNLEQESLDIIQEHYKVPVFALGPLHTLTPSPPTYFLKEDDTCIAWLDKQAPKSVLYVSIGSLVTLDAKLLHEMACGLAKSNQRFLWAVRPSSVSGSQWTEFLPEGFLEETKHQGLIVKWAPQKEVLAHFAIGGFWSHCGWNSTLESVSEGVPMICQPFTADQWVNARYVSYVWKIGLELERFERPEMESMIRRLMVSEEGEEIRVRVNDVKEMVKEAVKKGGSSHEALEELASFILSC